MSNDLAVGREARATTTLKNDPDYLALSRILARYQYLILLTPSSDETLNARLGPGQKRIQSELWSPLPFHRMQWLHSIEGARTLLLKLEQASQAIKVQRTKREVVKDLAEKRVVIKRLRSRVEEIGREVESTNINRYAAEDEKLDDDETMFDVLQQIRQQKQGLSSEEITQNGLWQQVQEHAGEQRAGHTSERVEQIETSARHEIAATLRHRQNQSVDHGQQSKAKTSGFSNLPAIETSLLASSKEHEDITTSLISMAAQLKQQARQFQFTLDQDKGMIDRALEGLDQNVSAMSLASKGMKTLQRMSEEQGWWGRIKLQIFIAAMWTVAILLVFAGPKLRF